MKKLLSAVIACCLLASCSEEKEIKVYRLAKGSQSPADSHPVTESTQDIRWSVPREWEELPATGMRRGSFIVRAEEGNEVDISVIFLDGSAGGDLPNVNRWREQLALEPWSYEEYLNRHILIETPLGPAKVVDFIGKDHERIVAANIRHQSGTWFFKMKGEQHLAELQKPNFFRFLSTLEEK